MIFLSSGTPFLLLNFSRLIGTPYNEDIFLELERLEHDTDEYHVEDTNLITMGTYPNKLKIRSEKRNKD